MANPRFEKLFHSLLDSSALQILTFPSLTHCLNTATTMTFKLSLTQYLPWGLLAQTPTTRLARMHRQLAGYYQKEPDSLFMVQIAQGMVHMGKGTIGLNPFFSDRSIMSRPTVTGLLAILTAFTDAKSCN